VENPLKNAVHQHHPKNHSSDFLSEAETGKKNSPTKKLESDLKQNQPYMYKIAYLICKNIIDEKILGLAG
jgi:hypothetical protein